MNQVMTLWQDWPHGDTSRFGYLLLAAAILTVVAGTHLRKLRQQSKIVTLATSQNSDQKKASPELQITPLTSFDWTTKEADKFRPFKPVYHITMALQNSNISDLIQPDKNYKDRIALRKSLIQKHGSTVHGLVPEGEDAVRELYHFLLVEYLPVRFPTLFSVSEKDGVFHNRITGATHPLDISDDLAGALRVIAETVEDDIFLLKETPDGHRSVAFVCCFPSGFDPSEKLGKLLREIHGPVPSYSKIGGSMERFFSRVEVYQCVKRLNWSVQTHDELFNCAGNHITGEETHIKSDTNVNLDKTRLRIELQSLTRLPKTRAVLFSFKTHVESLEDVKAEGSGLALADAIEGLKKGNAPGMWVYKSGVRWGDKVCQYLRDTGRDEATRAEIS